MKDHLILMPRNSVKQYLVGSICFVAMQLVEDQLRSGD